MHSALLRFQKENHRDAHLSLSYVHQKLLDEDYVYDIESGWYQYGLRTSTDFVEMNVEDQQKNGWNARIYTRERDKRKFYIPAHCEYYLNFMEEPVLYRR